MKSAFKKALALILAVMTTVSCFALIPASAETTEPAAASTTEKVLWEYDFDDLAGKSASNLRSALIEKGLYFVNGEGNTSANLTSKSSVTSDGMLKTNEIISAVPYQHFVNKSVVSSGATTPESGDIFYNLFYGLLTTDGNAMAADYSNQLKEYYFDYDYKTDGVVATSVPLDTTATSDDLLGYHITEKTTPTKDGKAGSATTKTYYCFDLPEGLTVGTNTVVVGKDNDADTTYDTVVSTVKYVKIIYKLIYSATRGESIFTVKGTGSYQYLLKVTPDGWLYTPDNGTGDVAISLSKDPTTSTGKYAASLYNPNLNVSVSYAELDANGNVVGTETSFKAERAMTVELYNEIKDAYTNHTRNGNLPSKTEWNQANLYVPGRPGAMLIEKQTTKMRLAFTADGTKITAKLYVLLPEDFAEGGWTYVGEKTYEYKAPEVGNANACIRFNEAKGNSYFDNFKLWTFEENVTCANGNHAFETNLVAPAILNYEGVFASATTCAVCGYTKTIENKVTNLLSLDFESMKSGDFSTSHPDIISITNTTLNADKGGAYVNNGEFKIKSPITDSNEVYYLSTKVNFEQFPQDQGAASTEQGASFFTFQSKSDDYSRLYARVGRTNNADVTSDGWIKLYQPTRQNDWREIHVAAELKRGVDYEFTFVIIPATSTLHLYVDGQYKASGYLGSGAPIRTDSSSDYPAFRIANQRNIKATFKNLRVYTIDSSASYKLSNSIISANATVSPFLSSGSKLVLKYDEANGVYVANDTYKSAVLNITNKDIFTKPFNLTFDFKVDDMGYFNDSSTGGTQFWSIFAALSSKSGAISTHTKLRLGGLDLSSDSDNVFDKLIFTTPDSYEKTLTSENTGYQSTQHNTTTPYYTDESAIYNILPGEWNTISITSDPYTKFMLIYVNGRLVANSKTEGIPYNTTLDSAHLRIGDTFRKFLYNWNVKDINLEFTADPLQGTASGDIYYNNFRTATDIGDSADANQRFGHIYSRTSTSTVVTDNNGTKLLHYYGGASWLGNAHLNLYTSSLRADGTIYNVLEGDKYAITLDFALNSRAYRDGEVKDGDSSVLTSDARNSAILRMSKYFDSNKVALVNCGDTEGLYISKGSTTVYLYNAAGISYNAWTTVEQTFDDNGKILTATPEKWTKVTVVIDESRNTASYYVNDMLAYYSSTKPTNGKVDPSKLSPAFNLPFNVSTSADTKFPGGSKDNWDGTFASLPYTDGTVGYFEHMNSNNKKKFDTGYSRQSYIRILQNTLDACVRELSITRISDNTMSYSSDFTQTTYTRNDEIEFIGTQTRNLSANNPTFDMRFVFGVDNLFVDKIRYNVTASVNDGITGNTESFENTEVYSVLKSEGADVVAAKYSSGSYLSFVTISDIEYMEGNTYTINIMPEYVIYNKVTNTEEVAPLGGYRITISGTGELISCTSR